MIPMAKPEISVEWIEPQYVDVIWPHLEPGFAEASAKTGSEIPTHMIYERIMDTDWLLHVVYEDDLVLGAGVIQPMPTAKGMWLNIPFGFSIDPIRTDGLDAFFEHVENQAREHDAIGVKMASARRGFMRRMKRRGYRQRLVEFVLRFEEEDE